MAGRRNLTLDLKPAVTEMTGGGRGLGGGSATASGIAPSKKAQLNGKPDLLTSPDVQMLKLTSPQLAEFLTRNSTLATPTPSGGYQFPTSVTAELELYVRGFEEALKMKHQQGSTTTSSASTGSNTPAYILAIEKATAAYKQKQQQIQPQLPSVPVIIPQATLPATISSGIPTIDICSAASVTSEPSSTNYRPSSSASGSYNDDSASAYLPTVAAMQEPGLDNAASKLPTSSSSRTSKGGKSNRKSSSNVRGGMGILPIDMESKELIKLKRKRLGNRLAASKCRKRKLERISNLDEKVQYLKSESGELLAIVKRLKESVYNLEQEVMEHVHHGCQINLV